MSGKEPHGKDPVPPELPKRVMDQAASRDTTASPQGGSTKPPINPSEEPEAEPIDLSGVTILRRNWKEPGLVLRFGEYTGKATTLTIEPYMDLCTQVGTGNPKAPYIDIHVLKDGSGDIAGVPSITQNKNTLEVSWSQGGASFGIDMAPYLMIRPFVMPEGTRAHLPIEFKSLRGVGPCIVIHFSQAAFSKIEKGTPRKKKNREQPQPQPDQSEPTPDKQ